MEFRQYNRKEKAELREVTNGEIETKDLRVPITEHAGTQKIITVSVSEVDRENGSPKKGDMIARNPKNHSDQWLVAKAYFQDNFEGINQNQD